MKEVAKIRKYLLSLLEGSESMEDVYLTGANDDIVKGVEKFISKYNVGTLNEDKSITFNKAFLKWMSIDDVKTIIEFVGTTKALRICEIFAIRAFKQVCEEKGLLIGDDNILNLNGHPRCHAILSSIERGGFGEPIDKTSIKINDSVPIAELTKYTGYDKKHLARYDYHLIFSGYRVQTLFMIIMP